MAESHLGAIDLNLLVILDALLEERSVTRAADRVGMTQPAMSHALGRLRKLFDDPLLLRTPRGMVPTARAEALIEPVRRALGELERAVFHRPAFDPLVERRSFSIGAADYAETVLLPPLLEQIGKKAPGIDLMVRVFRAEDMEEDLESGQLDLAITVLQDNEQPAVVQKRLFQERFVCVVRKDHPNVGEALTLEEYVSLSHALISPRGRKGGYVERELAKLGLSRRVALTVPHFLVAPMVVAQSDLVLTLPERLAKIFASMLPLRVVDPPLPVPGFNVSQVWHERQQHDPAHVWLRGLIMEVSRGL